MKEKKGRSVCLFVSTHSPTVSREKSLACMDIQVMKKKFLEKQVPFCLGIECQPFTNMPILFLIIKQTSSQHLSVSEDPVVFSGQHLQVYTAGQYLHLFPSKKKKKEQLPITSL